MLQCVKNGVEKVGIALYRRHLRMASLYPATMLGEKKLGAIEPGSTAHFVFASMKTWIEQVLWTGNELMFPYRDGKYFLKR